MPAGPVRRRDPHIGLTLVQRPALEGEARRLPICPDDADRIFYGATGQPLVTAREVARIIMDLVPGSQIEIPDVLTEADQMELPYRGRLAIENARTQLGWNPRFKDIRDGLADYIERYRAFLAAERGDPGA